MFLISSVMMFILNIIRGSQFNFNHEFESELYLCAAYTIIGATLLTYFLNNWALKRAASGNVALFIYLQPIVAGIIGYFFLGEEVTLRMFTCSLLIVVGVVISLRK
jgi:drug/metabolite transporter (DMT)-like permease